MSTNRFLKADPIVDFPRAEAEIRKFWDDNDIFQKSVRHRAGRPGFVWHDGPPTANGTPHNGHVLTRVFKDLFPRYRTMRGYYSPRKAGWDTHGLPVEVEVEKQLGIHGKEEIEKYGVEAFIERCMASVFQYTKEWEEMTERMGHWVDLSDAYVTYHREYIESVWWALSKLFDKGLLYKGHKVVWWWAQGGTALSAAEVGLGYKTVDDPSVFIKFPLVDEPDTALLVWTTTPWTLPSNMYAAVKPEIDYVVVSDAEPTGPDGVTKLILAAALRESLEEKLGRSLVVDRQLKGSDLVGKRYRPPFDDYYAIFGEREVALADGQREPLLWKVLAADFVELDQGTGLVHEAPAFGEVDHELHRNLVSRYAEGQEIPLLCGVGPDGKFTDEIPSLAGEWVKQADKSIIKRLKETGSLLHHENYRHEYPFCWRADDDPLIQYARPAWFIQTTARNKEAIQNNRAVNWIPEHIKEGRFGDFLANNVDWALSRERYWGTPLNIWVNDVSGEMVAPASMAEILDKNPNAFDHFWAAKKERPELSEHLVVHKPWIDDVTWVEDAKPGVFRRVSEVIDCWFDSGSMPFAQWGFPHKGKALFEKSFPSDYITEAIDQTRGWFYSMLMISTLVFDDETQRELEMEPRSYPHPYQTCIVLGHVTDTEGKKESKSKGNYTPPEVILDRVAMDFAVTDGEEFAASATDSEAMIAREDLQGLDLLPGASVRLRGTGGELELEIKQAKRLPRRLVVLSANNRQRLAASPIENARSMKPADVPRLDSSKKVTIEDLSGSAPGADAFRWFFLAANPPWNPTRHSLGNVRALQKEFLIKLRNVYSFFTIFANIDDFDPHVDQGRPVQERADLDRWILSELSRLNKAVIDYLDAYRAYEAARELSEFVESLSNWYLRRSRPRFWKAERDAEKIDAYATMYEVLTTIVALAAPFVPFVTEDMYQNLVRRVSDNQRAPESVHLSDFPTPDESRIDQSLNEEMATVRAIVSLGLRVRTEHKLKVRQPLQSAEVTLSNPRLESALAGYGQMIADELNVQDLSFVQDAGGHVTYQVVPNFRSLGPRVGKKMKALKSALTEADGASLRSELVDKGEVSVDVEGEPFVLTLDDVEVRVTAKQGYAAAGDTAAVLVLNTELTSELVEEGVYRELLSRIQALRKELGLEYTQRIRLLIEGSARLNAIVAARKEHLMGETLCVSLEDSVDGDFVQREVRVEGEPVRLAMAKA